VTTTKFRTAGVVIGAAPMRILRTGQGRGAAHLDEGLDREYDLLPLQFPDPDRTDLPAAAEYARYVSKFFDEPTSDLLDRLSDEHGLMWLTVARVTGVSVPALRKWRHGGNPTPENKLALARLLAACDGLAELGVSDVAAWLSTPIRLDQSRLRFELLTLPEGGEPLLALAQDKISADQALDALVPRWREQHVKPTTEVTVGPDGMGTVHLAET
jgi:transcriptional regulator with XRE-family HTH domain